MELTPGGESYKVAHSLGTWICVICAIGGSKTAKRWHGGGMSWYYAKDGQQEGPVADEQLVQLVMSGLIGPSTLVWRAGMGDWRPLGEMRPELAALAAQRQPTKPKLRYASFGVRFGAKMLDWTLIQLLVTIAILGFIAWAYAKQRWLLTPDLAHGDITGVLLLVLVCTGITLGVEMAYNWYFLAKYQSTPGKLALGLKVVRSDGGKPRLAELFQRLFWERISGLILMIGYLMAAWDHEEHCALHDKLSNTRVVVMK